MNVTTEGPLSGLIPKNPWVAVAVFGGIALVTYAIFEEFQKTEKATASALGSVVNSGTSAPGALVNQTLSQTGEGIRNLWDQVIYDPIHNLFFGTNSTTAPAATPTTNPNTLTSAS